jgi:NAD(P)-dependent dehydrogenase (short-subunit alcohol dehydrogenase family)
MNDLFSLAGRTALVTGGSRGIGRMIAAGFLAQGARVYISSRKAEACTRPPPSSPPPGRASRCPPTSRRWTASRPRRSVRRARGTARHPRQQRRRGWGETFDTFPEKGWDKVVDLNLKTPFFLTQALIRPLRAAASAERPAKVINVASIDGISVNPLETYSYAASKAGLIQLTRRMALRLAPEQIVVSGIAPGAFASEMNRAARDHGDEIAQRIPVAADRPRRGHGGRRDLPGSRAGDYVVGTTLVVDGGVTLAR